MSTESIKAKIAALLAKAEGTDNAFEAETFMAKVNELLEKHQLEMHEIRKTGGDKDPMGHEMGGTNLYASMIWARGVASALARYYGCKMLYWRRGNHTIYEITGRESARTTFELMLPYVISQVRVQAKRVAGELGTTKSRSEADVGKALEARIWRMVPKAEARRDDLAKNALVPVDDVQAYVDERYGDVKKARKRDLDHSYEAQEAAAKVSLHHQATGKHTKLLEA